MFDQRSYFTSEVLDLLRRSNPKTHVTEGRVRSAIRSGRVRAPRATSGCYLWTYADIDALATALDLKLREDSAPTTEVQP